MSAQVVPETGPLAALEGQGSPARLMQPIDRDAFYAAWQVLGLAYGASFQGLHDIRCGDGVASARLDLPGDLPAWLDSAFQLIGALLLGEAQQRQSIPVPVALERLSLALPARAEPAMVTARLRQVDARGISADLLLCRFDGTLIARIDGLRLHWLRTRPERLAYAWSTRAAPPSVQAPAVDSEWLVLGSDADRARRLVSDVGRGGGRARLLPAWGHGRSYGLGAALEAARLPGLLVLVPDTPANDGGQAVDAAVAHCRALQPLLAECDLACTGRRMTLCLVARSSAVAAGSLAAAAALAFWHSAALELPALTLRYVELPDVLSDAEAELFARSLDGDESEWRVQGGGLLVQRLEPALAAGGAAARTALQGPGATLVTGGTGALGLQLAQWLAGQGVHHLLLASRQLQLSPEAAARLDELRERGCRIDLCAVDVSRRHEVAGLLSLLKAENVALRSVFHAAGAVADASLLSLDAAHWQQAVDAKVRGAMWLDELTREMPLQAFVAFSSAAAPLGSAGQCNYAAANGMLEALMQRRRDHARAAGLATRVLTLQWGPWAGEGMAAPARVQQAMSRRGIEPLDPADALQALQAALQGDADRVLVGRFDWPRLAAGGTAPPPSPIRALLQAEPAAALAAERPARPTAEQLARMDRAGSLEAIRGELAAQLTHALRLDPGQLPVQDVPRFERLRLSALGLDSLMAMDIRSRLRAWIGIDLPAHLLIGTTEIGEVVELIHQKVLVRSLTQLSSEADTDPDENMDVVLL